MSRIHYGGCAALLSWGRSGWLKTSGLYLTPVFKQRRPDPPKYEEYLDCVHLQPINSRGGISETTQVAVAVKAIPELIKALQEIYDNN